MIYKFRDILTGKYYKFESDNNGETFEARQKLIKEASEKLNIDINVLTLLVKKK